MKKIKLTTSNNDAHSQILLENKLSNKLKLFNENDCKSMKIIYVMNSNFVNYTSTFLKKYKFIYLSKKIFNKENNPLFLNSEHKNQKEYYFTNNIIKLSLKSELKSDNKENNFYQELGKANVDSYNYKENNYINLDEAKYLKKDIYEEHHPSDNFSFLKDNQPKIEIKKEHNYFNIVNGCCSNFLILPNSKAFMLLPYQIPQVREILLTCTKNCRISSILDATAHVGGDTINFCETFPHADITSLDINPDAVICLLHNISVIRTQLTNCNKINLLREDNNFEKRASFCSTSSKFTNFTLGIWTALNIDCVFYIKNIKKQFDLIYFDPPWGGYNYKYQNNIHLKLNDIPITCIINYIITHCLAKHIILKAPTNFDTNQFIKEINNHPISIYSIKKKKNLISYYLIHLTLVNEKNNILQN